MYGYTKLGSERGQYFLTRNNNESTEQIHGLYEGAELVQYSYETVIKCFEKKLPNRKNPAYESESRRKKLRNERPQQQNSKNFKDFKNFENRNQNYKKQRLPTDTILPRLSDSILSNKFLWPQF